MRRREALALLAVAALPRPLQAEAAQRALLDATVDFAGAGFLRFVEAAGVRARRRPGRETSIVGFGKA